VALVTYVYNHGEPIAQAPHDLLVDSLEEIASALQVQFKAA
jgi:phosphoglycolate phosphatase